MEIFSWWTIRRSCVSGSGRTTKSCTNTGEFSSTRIIEPLLFFYSVSSVRFSQNSPIPAFFFSPWPSGLSRWIVYFLGRHGFCSKRISSFSLVALGLAKRYSVLSLRCGDEGGGGGLGVRCSSQHERTSTAITSFCKGSCRAEEGRWALPGLFGWHICFLSRSPSSNLMYEGEFDRS